MDNKKRFFYNGILLTAVGIAMRTVALLFNAFVTQTVGAEGIGLYTIINTVYGFAVTFATSGISLTVTRLIAAARGEGREKDSGRILSGAVIYALLFSASATLVLFFGSDFLSANILHDQRAAISLRILAPSLVPLSLVAVFSGYFIGIRKVFCNAAAQISGQLFKIAITVFLLQRSATLEIKTSALYLSLGTTLTEIFSFLIILFQFLLERRKKSASEMRGADISSVASVAFPLGISAYIRSALLTIEHILIPKRLRDRGDSLSAALSSYGTLHGMALPMILYPMVTLSSFSGLLVPEFAERSAGDDKEGMRRLASRAFGMTLTYATLASCLLFIFSEELGYIIYDSYTAGKYIAILAPVVPIMYLDHVTDSVLKGIGEHVYSMWINISDSILSIILVWFLIPKMGIIGYALCIIIMEAYNFIFSAIRLFTRIRFKINIFASVIYPMLAAFAASLTVNCIFISAGAGTTVFLLIMKIAFTVCLFIGIYRTLLLLESFVKKIRKTAF